MLKARVIACLDVRWGKTVKGVNFLGLRELGDPVERALSYARDGADEIVWLDIQATLDQAQPRADLIRRLRETLAIPLTVGGGIRTLADVETVLEAGADKVSLNSYALENPRIIEAVAQRWGSQCVVVAVDARRVDGQFRVYSHGGRVDTGWELLEWIRTSEAAGCGEFLVTSMDQDGRQQGYDLPMLSAAREATKRPIVCSGGAGQTDDIARLLDQGHTACLLASTLHEGRMHLADVKHELAQRGYPVRENR